MCVCLTDVCVSVCSPAIPPSKGAVIGGASETGVLPQAQDAAQPGVGLLSWMKDAVSSGGILSRVAERAKSSVDSMITTLDPQMREFIYSGGDVDILVASDKEAKISPIREAFQVNILITYFLYVCLYVKCINLQ